VKIGGPEMDADRVEEAVRRFVLGRTETVERRWDLPNAVTLKTRRFQYRVEPADWQLGDGDSLRVLADDGSAGHLPTYGLLLEPGGDTLFLNDVATMRALGARIGTGPEPLGYADVLAELHSSRGTQDATVSRPSTPGALIRDPDEFSARYPFVDPGLLAAPAVEGDGAHHVITFRSFVRYPLSGYGSALDLFDWTVTARTGEPAEWDRRDAAIRLEIPRPGA
jgi:hypothetical protein